MKTHFAVFRREYSGFGRSFGRKTDELTRACSINARTSLGTLTKIIADVDCGLCKRTFEYRSAVAREDGSR